MKKSMVVTEQKAVWGIIKALDTVTSEDLQKALECTPQAANYWLAKFTRLGYLEKVRLGKIYAYAVNARGKVLQGDINTPDTYRPDVTITCEHKHAGFIPAGDGTGYYECQDCYMTFDDNPAPMWRGMPF